MSESSFLSRWSKRKAAVAAEAAQAEEIAKPADAAGAPTSPRVDLPQPIADAKHENGASAAPPPLPDIETLNGASDFSPFMAKDVSSEMRNQAMKKLFADPHYNVMDGLDIYIDDYGKPDPLPAGWLESMNQSKALRLFETPAEEEARLAADQRPSATPVRPASAQSATQPDAGQPGNGSSTEQPALASDSRGTSDSSGEVVAEGLVELDKTGPTITSSQLV
jgi:hypothetical protein